MTRDELFSAVRKNLEEHQVKFEAMPDSGAFELRIFGKAGSWQTTILCEEEPLMVHVICRLELKPAQEAVLRISHLMHGLNDRIRLGAFYLGPNGFPFYRLALPVFPEADMNSQIEHLIGTAISTMDQHLRMLTLAGNDTAEVRRQIAEIAPEALESEAAGCLIPKSRLKLN